MEQGNRETIIMIYGELNILKKCSTFYHLFIGTLSYAIYSYIPVGSADDDGVIFYYPFKKYVEFCLLLFLSKSDTLLSL